jgi:hypothetical protein
MSHYVGESLRAAGDLGLTTEEAARAILVVEMQHWDPLLGVSLQSVAILVKTLAPNMIQNALDALPATDPTRTKYIRWTTAAGALNGLMLAVLLTYYSMDLDPNEAADLNFWYADGVGYGAEFGGEAGYGAELDPDETYSDIFEDAESAESYVRAVLLAMYERRQALPAGTAYDDNPRHYACGL